MTIEYLRGVIYYLSLILYLTTVRKSFLSASSFVGLKVNFQSLKRFNLCEE